MSDERHEPWIERCERCACVVVPVLGDAHEEDAVPASPDVGCVAEVVDERRIPARGVRMPIRLEPQEREDRRNPDRSAAPEEDAECGRSRWTRSQLTPSDDVCPKP